MSQADLLDQDPAFQLKGSMLATTVLELLHADLAALDSQLRDKVAQAPNFFSNIPLVLALDKLPEDSQVDLAELCRLCQRHGLRIMALRSAHEAHLAQAASLELAVLPPSGARERLIVPAESVTQPRPPEPPKAPEARPTRMINSPVRGGMQVYAEGGDLVVLAPVSAGAELLADGNIHVYGPMRGRALAGVKGNTRARIFCQQMGAELLSIAGEYKVAEDLRRDPAWGEAVQVALVGDVLKITRL